MIEISNYQVKALIDKLKATDTADIECLYGIIGHAAESRRPQTIMNIILCLSSLPPSVNHFFESLTNYEKCIVLHLFVEALYDD